MGKFPHDINDDEIRIISSEKKSSPTDSSASMREPTYSKQSSKRSKWLIVVAVIFIATLIGLIVWWVKIEDEEPDRLGIVTEEQVKGNMIDPKNEDEATVAPPDAIQAEKGFVTLYDTIVNKIPLSIFTPKNAVPRLHVGSEVLKDSSAVFVVQAADIRRDNGQIVGAYVADGNLLSKGQSKAGFCAIINGKLIIGVADSTPYLEQAIETGGYFFRQYPLVVGGQVVENKLKPSSLRKALAELNGETVVVMSDRKQTLNEFSKTLVDLGVTNAIYLVGSSAYGYAIDEEGRRIEFGLETDNPLENTNYIVWK